MYDAKILDEIIKGISGITGAMGKLYSSKNETY
jgi:hypothetical protein